MAEIPTWQKRREEEEEEEEELDETNYISQKDAVLFAIDVSATMLAPPLSSDDKKAEKDSPTLAAIKCAYQIMQQRIISSPKDMMGVLLFGTEKSKFQDEDENDRGSIQYPHCYLLGDLNVPSAEDVKTLKAIVEGEEEYDDILVPSEEPASMTNVLFCANQIFMTRAPTFGSRRLFIITDNDDPCGSDKAANTSATVRAKDLYDLGVVIELFPISHPDHQFDRSKFYDDIIYRDPADGEDLAIAPANFKSASTDGISLLGNLIADINSKQVAKRTLFSGLPFEIGPGFKISVKGYNLLQREKPNRSCFVYLDGEVAQIAVGKTDKYTDGGQEEVAKDQIEKAYEFGKSRVFFTSEEQKELKNFGPPGLRIIGFKPQSLLPMWASVKKATFIYPSEEDYVGSTRVFAALWQKLLKDKKMGVAWYIARKNAVPTLVAILPSEERLEEGTKVPVTPAGLWLYQLPFADDIRPTPEIPMPMPVAPDRLIDAMRIVVQQLQLPKAIYDPSKYPNPALQWHYRILQAIALEEDVPEIPEDKTVPKYRQIEKRAGKYLHEWGVILAEEHMKWNKTSGSGKHEHGEDDVGPAKPRKKARKENESLGSMNKEELKSAVVSGGLAKFLLGDLKAFLVGKGLNGAGKKADLIERIEAWVENH